MRHLTFVSEDTFTRVEVYHEGKVVFYREVSYWVPVQALRDARAEAEKLVEFLRENPDAEAAPLPEGWTWRKL